MISTVRPVYRGQSLSTDVMHGDLSLEDDGAFSYTPDSDFNGEDSFTYRVDTGADSSAAALVTLTVAAGER